MAGACGRSGRAGHGLLVRWQPALPTALHPSAFRRVKRRAASSPPISLLQFEDPPLHDPCAVAYVIAPQLFKASCRNLLALPHSQPCLCKHLLTERSAGGCAVAEQMHTPPMAAQILPFRTLPACCRLNCCGWTWKPFFSLSLPASLMPHSLPHCLPLLLRRRSCCGWMWKPAPLSPPARQLWTSGTSPPSQRTAPSEWCEQGQSAELAVVQHHWVAELAGLAGEQHGCAVAQELLAEACHLLLPNRAWVCHCVFAFAASSPSRRWTWLGSGTCRLRPSMRLTGTRRSTAVRRSRPECHSMQERHCSVAKSFHNPRACSTARVTLCAKTGFRLSVPQAKRYSTGAAKLHALQGLIEGKGEAAPVLKSKLRVNPHSMS